MNFGINYCLWNKIINSDLDDYKKITSKISIDLVAVSLVIFQIYILQLNMYLTVRYGKSLSVILVFWPLLLKGIFVYK